MLGHRADDAVVAGLPQAAPAVEAGLVGAGVDREVRFQWQLRGDEAGKEPRVSGHQVLDRGLLGQ